MFFQRLRCGTVLKAERHGMRWKASRERMEAAYGMLRSLECSRFYPRGTEECLKIAPKPSYDLPKPFLPHLPLSPQITRHSDPWAS